MSAFIITRIQTGSQRGLHLPSSTRVSTTPTRRESVFSRQVFSDRFDDKHGPNVLVEAG